MSRRFKVTAGSKLGAGGNEVNVNIKQLERLNSYISSAYDLLEEMDDYTFQACDGEALIDDLDVAIREVAQAIKEYGDMEDYDLDEDEF